MTRSFVCIRRALAACAVGVAAGAMAQVPQFETVAAGLENPWAVAFLPDGRYLVTERPGRMRVVDADGRLRAPIAGVPEVIARGQGGLLDVVLDREFAANRTLYFCFSEPGDGGNGTALARARLAPDERALQDLQVIFRQMPKVQSNLHFGCRIVEARDGTLFLTLGERNSMREQAQNPANHLGKVVHVHKDGRTPSDNPQRTGWAPQVWSIGHRNAQGATLAPDGTFWMHEHGPQGGDEINVPRPGLNYGWPVITHGEQYGGGPIGDGITSRPGMEQPLYHWVPSIAPSGMAFLTSTQYGQAWQGNLFVGSLKFGQLVRLELRGNRIANETRYRVGERVRDVRQGPDGYLYLVTDERNGKLMRVKPG